jgi:hypothetical protein
MYNLPPMARNSFLFASTSFEMRCQWPMVRPVSLNGAGCAVAVPELSAKPSKKMVNRLVFTDASLLSWSWPLSSLDGKPVSKYHACLAAESLNSGSADWLPM